MMEITENEVKNLARFAKDGKIIIEVREGDAEKFLDPVEPLEEESLRIAGSVGTVFNFLSRRHTEFEPKNCHIRVAENSMRFTGNECQAEDKHKTNIISEITPTKHYETLEVETGREFEALELARYLRKRKYMFVNPEQFNSVWTALSSFKAEINKQVEKADTRDGNAVNSIRQTVTHNMPRHFDLLVPVFENSDPIQIEVEVDVNPNNLECSLMSFDIEQKYEDLRKSLFEAELDQEISDKLKLRDFCVVYYA